MQAKPSHYCEGLARLDPGPGFFRPDSRPARDCGVLLLRWLAGQKAAAEPLAVLDGLAGCGIRALRYGLEAHATEIWANDADPDRLPLLQRNLGALGGARCSAITIQKLLAECAAVEQRFDFVDLDAFGAPMALVPWALEAVRFGGIVYLASTDGRSFTGHDRTAAVRRLGLPRGRSPAVGSWLCVCSWARLPAALGRWGAASARC